MSKEQGCQVSNHQKSGIDEVGVSRTVITRLVLLPIVSLGLVLSVACTSKDKKMADAKGTEMKQEAAAKMGDKKADMGKMAGKMKGRMVCNTGKDTRELLIEKTEDAKKFDLVYTKRGKSQNIANGSWSHCERISARVAQTLTEAGFTCQ